MELHSWWIARIKQDLVESAQLSDQDLALLSHEHLGHSTDFIANALRISPGEVDSRFRHINAKLGVPNRRAAARLALEHGLI